MGRKSNTPYEIKLAAVEAYEHNEGSLKTISERFGKIKKILNAGFGYIVHKEKKDYCLQMLTNIGIRISKYLQCKNTLPGSIL